MDTGAIGQYIKDSNAVNLLTGQISAARDRMSNVERDILEACPPEKAVVVFDGPDVSKGYVVIPSLNQRPFKVHPISVVFGR